MKNKYFSVQIAAIAIVIGIVIAIYFYNLNKENKDRIKELEEDRLKLILDSIKREKGLSEEIKSQLKKLINDFEKIDDKISNELVQALQLLQINQVENAIEDLVKIIEYLLKKYYGKHDNFNRWLKSNNKKNPDLYTLLTYCKKDNKITEIEYRFFIAIKTIRNNEAHELNLKLDNYLNSSGIMTAIGAIIKISKFVYPKQ